MVMSSSVLEPFESSNAVRKEVVNYVERLFEAVRVWPSSSDRDAIEIQRPNCMQKDATDMGTCIILRPVSMEEIDTLTCTCHCTSDHWEQILVMVVQPKQREPPFVNLDNLSEYLIQQYYQCSFAGRVVLGVCTHQHLIDDEDALPPGARFNTHIVNCILEPNCRVYHNTILSNTFVASSASVIHCGSVRCIKDNITTPPLESLDITVGPETGGGRSVKVIPESTMIDVISSLQHSTTLNPWTLPRIEPCYASSYNIILGCVSHVDTILHIYSDTSSIIQSCPSISKTLLLANASITHGCIVDSSLLQWNASITNHSTVSSTLLMEHSHIGPNSLVQHTILGPDSHVSCGEVHCSVIGPNTNAHHQSLIISTLWPLGRGNVAYGCNMGSNHTSRLPDQEMVSGEGMFYGLGTSLKFPLNFSASPYSIVAAGACLPPQRVSMPFSLIVGHDSSTITRNEIVPGWVLHSSPYTIVRNEVKFMTRRKATRHGFYTGWTIARPDIVNLCYRTRQALLELKTDECTTTGFYTQTSLQALGLNIMTEKGRNVGIAAYSHWIQRYALHGLFEYVSLATVEDPTGSIHELIDALIQQRRDYYIFQSDRHNPLTDEIHASIPLPDESSFHHALLILLLEYPDIVKDMHLDSEDGTLRVLCILFDKMLKLERQFVKGVEDSKRRDELRGQEIILDYSDAHVLAADDATVQLAQVNMDKLQKKVQVILSKIANMV